MGTNYYLRNKQLREAAIEAKKQEKALQVALGGHDKYSWPSYYTEEWEGLHIGKSSAGWFFNLCVYPDMGINELSDWEKAWADPHFDIVDEYGRVISPQEMLDEILNRHSDVTKEWMEEQYKTGGLTRGTCALSKKYGLMYGTTDGVRSHELGARGPYTLTKEVDFS
jgi:hypothetical protein